MYNDKITYINVRGKKSTITDFDLTCFNVMLSLLKIGPNKSGVQAEIALSSLELCAMRDRYQG